MPEETIGQTIERIARECGVDPNDPVFRARLTKAMLERGIFPAPKRDN